MYIPSTHIPTHILLHTWVRCLPGTRLDRFSLYTIVLQKLHPLYVDNTIQLLRPPWTAHIRVTRLPITGSIAKPTLCCLLLPDPERYLSSIESPSLFNPFDTFVPAYILLTYRRRRRRRHLLVANPLQHRCVLSNRRHTTTLTAARRLSTRLVVALSLSTRTYLSARTSRIRPTLLES
jgi:hypothetical protein